MNVQLDQFTQRVVPVEIEQGVPPAGLTVGVMDVEPKQVTVEGAKSLVDKVVKATGSVVIQEPGIDIDQDVDLIPVDSVGNRVSPVDLSPRVRPRDAAGVLGPPVPDAAGEARRSPGRRRPASRSRA